MSPLQLKALSEQGFVVKPTEEHVKVEVGKEHLTEFLEAHVHNDVELVTVEPKRFTLEDFFMGFLG